MDSVFQSAFSSSSSSSSAIGSSKYDDVFTIKKCAADFRAALDREIAQSRKSSTQVSTDGDRPLFVGVKPELGETRGGKRGDPPSSSSSSSSQTGYESPQKSVRQSVLEMQSMPLDVLQRFLAETLFPYRLLHMNQLNYGKEWRPRFLFEQELFNEFKEAVQRYNAILGTSARFQWIARTPSTRQMLYQEYMATPPEGLYERPDPSSSIPHQEFRYKVRLAAYPTSTDRYGREILGQRWYHDFLTTVAYNEWQRAISLSSARAVQVFMVSQTPGLSFDSVDESFLKYWNLNNKANAFDFRMKAWSDQTRGNKPAFDGRDFPLTWDIDSYRFFGRARDTVPTERPQWPIFYQSFDQKGLRKMVQKNWLIPRNFVFPVSGEFMWILAMHHIEVVRFLQFRNTYDLKKYFPRGIRNVLQNLRADRTTFIKLLDPIRRGLSNNYGALVVDPPYDVSTARKSPIVYNHRGGIRPWHAKLTEGGSVKIFLNLSNFGVDRVTGMDEALVRMVGDPTSALITVDQAGLSPYDWTSRSYRETLDNERGPHPITKDPFLSEEEEEEEEGEEDENIKNM